MGRRTLQPLKTWPLEGAHSGDAGVLLSTQDSLLIGAPDGRLDRFDLEGTLLGVGSWDPDGLVAVEKTTGRVARLSQRIVTISTPGSPPEAKFSVPPTAENSRAALAFGPAGDSLLYSFERAYDDHCLHRYAIQDGHLREELPLRGCEQSGHFIHLDQSSDSLVIDISCGQDGSFHQCISFHDGAPHLDGVIERPNDPQGTVAFAASPQSIFLAASDPHAVTRLALADGRLLAASPALPERLFPHWQGARFGSSIAVLAQADREDPPHAVLLVYDDHQLQQLDRLELQTSTGCGLLEFAPIADDRFATLGWAPENRRAWVHVWRLPSR